MTRERALPAPRIATPEDIPALEAMIGLSARALSRGHYDPAQIEAVTEHVFGVDSELVADGTYYLIEDAAGPIGCGGWSRRRTLFGSDRFAARDDALLDPAQDAARIRAFFVHPDHARRGVAGALLAASEAAAAAAGFRALELMATLPGIAFYLRSGFVPGEQILHYAGDVAIPFVPMRKLLVTDAVAEGGDGSR